MGEPLNGGSANAELLLAELRKNSSGLRRYELLETFAKGGMGEIVEVRDRDLRRSLALKRLRADRAPTDGADPTGHRQLARFLDEAQITAQLSHPGVVPVHELGVDSDGRVYFTMALVQGRDLERIHALARAGAEGWSQTRVLGVLQKVCETMAYAHSRGVIHRDLKPANVMVGAFGEVYVMDWGLAKLAGKVEPRGAGPLPSTVRADTLDGDASSSLLTEEGDVLGTPAYMSPEQARGDGLDARSDVYAIGAMLYALFAGRAPYSSPNVRLPPLETLRAVQAGKLAALRQLAPDAPAELISICDKAMARDPGQRYAGAAELGEELRAFLENRVVRAHRTGAWIEFRKWVQRNRALALATAGGVLVLVAGLAAFAWKERQRAETGQRVLRLSDARKVRELKLELDRLWPPLPEMESALAHWSSGAGELYQRLGAHEAVLTELESQAVHDEQYEWWHETLSALIGELRTLPPLLEDAQRRRALAGSLREQTLDSPAAKELWAKATAEIASLPAYEGLRLAPQLGLLPLERDPHSGLWEFWHVLSGAQPVRGSKPGSWRIAEDTGIVLVLIPATQAHVGSRPVADPAQLGAYEDPDRQSDEIEISAVGLAAYFLSKYEITQAQWQHTMGENPSHYRGGRGIGGPDHPVEMISRRLAEEFSRRVALALPTEVQWEWGCRAGTTTPFWTGAGLRSLLGGADFADATSVRLKFTDVDQSTPELDDGYPVHAPVGSFAPNPFGLYDMLGNVWEWCADSYNVDARANEGDGLRAQAEGREGVIRGGSWYAPAQECRCANRMNYAVGNTEPDVGLRLARPVER